MYKNEISLHKSEVMNLVDAHRRQMREQEQALLLSAERESTRVDLELQAKAVAELAKFELNEAKMKSKYEAKLKGLVQSVILAKESYEKKGLEQQGTLRQARLELAGLQARCDSREKALREELTLKDARLSALQTDSHNGVLAHERDMGYWRDASVHLAMLVVQMCATAKTISRPHNPLDDYIMGGGGGGGTDGTAGVGSSEVIVSNDYLSKALKVSKVRRLRLAHYL